MTRAAIYLRVSTGEQTTENQRRDLDAAALHHGWQVVEVFEDAGISGAKGRDKRPALDAMLKAATCGKLDLIAAWHVDRLGRSLQHLVAMFAEMEANKVELYLHQQGINTTTPAGKAMFQMSGVFAELELAIIRDRILAGQARARASGTHMGRPFTTQDVADKIMACRSQGLGILKIARQLKIGTSVVQRVVAAK